MDTGFGSGKPLPPAYSPTTTDIIPYFIFDEKALFRRIGTGLRTKSEGTKSPEGLRIEN